MIRLYKETVGQLIGALVKVTKIDGLTIKQACEAASRHDVATRYDVARPINIGFHHNDDADQLFEDLVQQFNADEQNVRNGDSNLIEAIVRILQLPYARNVIGRNQLDALRRAVLTEDESAKATASLTKRELSCAFCSRVMANGEMVTIVREDSQTNVIACHNCRKPTLISCGKCIDSVPLPVYLSKASNKQIDCGCSARPKEAQPAVPDFNAPIQDLGQQLRNVVMNQPAAVGNWGFIDAAQQAGPRAARPRLGREFRPNRVQPLVVEEEPFDGPR